MPERHHIDHSKPLVYDFYDLTTGDKFVYDSHDAALAQVRRTDPKHSCEIIARNYAPPADDLGTCAAQRDV